MNLDLDELRYWTKEIIAWQKTQKRERDKAEKAAKRKRK
jgi:hypothetical protein